MTSRDHEKWGIVGGGLLGMTLAYRLAEQGKRVVLFEAAPQLGGLASAWTLGDIVWDRHYHVTLLSDAALRSVLRSIGLEDELKWTQTRTGFYTDGKLYSMSNTLEFLRFPPLNLAGKLRLGATIFYASRLTDWRALEQQPVGDWLRRLSGKHTYEKIWLPLLRAKLGDSYRDTSAAFIWATIARMYAARRSGLKKEMFGYVSGGYARILEKYAEALTGKGVEIRRDHRATAVLAQQSGSVRVEFDNQPPAEHDQVILTAAAPIAARLCPQLTEEERGRLAAVRYQGIICASLLLKRGLSPYYITNLTDPGLPFTAVIEMSQLVDPAQLGGHALVYLPKYVAPEDPAFALTDDEIKDRFLTALSRMHPQFALSDVLAFRVSRARFVFPIPTLGYSERLPSMQTSIPGLHIVNSAHIVNGTLNVNETITLANSAVPALLAQPRPAPETVS